MCSKFIGEHPCEGMISIKLHYNFIEIRLSHGVLLHIFRTPFYRNTSGGMLLKTERTLFERPAMLLNNTYIESLQNIFSIQYQKNSVKIFFTSFSQWSLFFSTTYLKLCLKRRSRMRIKRNNHSKICFIISAVRIMVKLDLSKPNS